MKRNAFAAMGSSLIGFAAPLLVGLSLVSPLAEALVEIEVIALVPD